MADYKVILRTGEELYLTGVDSVANYYEGSSINTGFRQYTIDSIIYEVPLDNLAGESNETEA